jgi:hypothetical protein
VEQVNLTTLVPGQLSVRGGSKTVTKTSTRMVELWGLSVGSGQTDTILGQGDGGNIVEFKSGVESLKNTGQFAGDHPVTFSQGRRGEVYIYQGYGKRGLVRDVTGTVRPVGLDAPTAKPEIAIDSSASYYVARIDLTDVGNGYHLAPAVSIAAPPSGGRQAAALSRIADATVSEIEVTDGGAGYEKVPCVTLTDTPNGPATGVGASAVIELEDGAAGGDPETGIVYWEVSQLPTFWWLCLNEYPREGNGYIVPAVGGSGRGARAIFFFDGLYGGNCYRPNSDGTELSSFGVRVQVYDFGSGYQPGDVVTATLHTAAVFQAGAGVPTGPRCDTTAECQLVAEGVSLYSPSAPDRLTIVNSNPYKQRKIRTTVANGGSGYLTPPVFQTEDGDIINTEVNCDGAVTKLILDQPNKVYLFPPKIISDQGDVGGAKALAIVRPNFRGLYQCYVRYANESVTKEQGGPLYSNLSPVNEVDAGECAKSLTWTLPSSQPASATHIELWRSTANQATTLFRVAKLTVGTASYLDTTHDKDLTDAKRADYEAQSILLSDGRLNLNAFGVPSEDFAAGVLFQDRLFIGVDTTGKRQNTLLYSEPDRPESVPEVNELVIQTNLRDSDYVSALIPYAGALVVAQSRHCHRLNFVSRPEIDATVSVIAYRGCLNQRCWDLYNGILYMVDDNGVYSLDPSGQVESLSDAIDTLFRDNTDSTIKSIDFGKREWFLLRQDRNQNCIRVLVAFKGDEGKYPTRMLVYTFDSKAWHLESYPFDFSAAAEIRPDSGNLFSVFANENGLVKLGEGLTDDGKPVPYAFRTGNMAFITDETDKNGGQQNSRGISVLYKPTMTESLLKLQWFANASETPRGNVARRDVGVGFTMDDTDPSSFVNMQSERHEGAPANGIARARFAGKTMTFVDGADTHVSLRLFGEQSDAGPVVIHELTVNGVQDNGK